MSDATNGREEYGAARTLLIDGGGGLSILEYSNISGGDADQ